MTEVKKTDEKRYDRQLRLWGDEGQSALENTRILLLGASGVGTETLKNLVLPGVGAFTILDGALVSAGDLGSNFFLEESQLGLPRAQVTCQILNELNDLVRGSWIHKDPLKVIDEEPNFFKDFTLVIANNLPQSGLLKLGHLLWDAGIPLLVIRSTGFLGSLRIVTPEHTIVEAKQDNPPDDLRIANPWGDLLAYAESFDFSKMNSTEHSHTPYPIILIQHINKWKANNSGNFPSNYKEKDAFKQTILKSSPSAKEENFQEAYKTAHKSYPTSLPSELKNVLGDPKAVVGNLHANSPNFWIIASAIKQFIDNEGGGMVPLMGSLPDMTATTELYIAIQKLYQEKANTDFTIVLRYVRAALSKLGKPETSISEEEVKKFCKNALFLQCIRYKSLQDEYQNLPSALDSGLGNDNSVNFYLALRAAESFSDKFHRSPGSGEDLEGDFQHLKEVCANILRQYGSSKVLDEKYLREIVRFGGSELHPLAALMGGVTAQEAIKLITHQYQPLNNTLVFNGMDCTSQAMKI